MIRRKTHKKSRRGCQNCKRRHVKCDEQGPPCAACVARNTTETCSYGDLAPWKDASSKSKSLPEAQSPLKSIQSSSLSPHGSANPVLSSNTSMVSYSDVFGMEDSASRRLLELRLMHRWTTQTYRSLCSMEMDKPYLQHDLPRAAFHYPFLLNSVLAMSALDIALVGDESDDASPGVYTEVALKYYDLASSQLRVALNNFTAESAFWVYMCSFIVSCIEMALPQCIFVGEESTMIERVCFLFDLFANGGIIAISNWDSMLESVAGESMRVAAVTTLTSKTADDDTEIVIRRLASIITAEDDVPSNLACSIGIQIPSHLKIPYIKAMKLLRLAFIEDSHGSVKGLCMAIPMWAGPEFASAARQSEPVALLLLMHWGVLMHRLATLHAVWWTMSVGRRIVEEASWILLQTQPQLLAVPEWSDGIQWAREEIGLPPLVEYVGVRL